MSVNTRMEGDVAVLDVSGKVIIGQVEVELRDAVQQALADGRMKILLVMNGVTALDSSGVGELMAAYTSASNRGAELKLARLSPKVSTVLQATRLTGVLDIHASEDEALATFAQPG